MKLPHRMCLADVCNALNLKRAVEVGTHHAIFADQFMSRFRGSITLVDPWQAQHEDFPTFYPTLSDISVSRDEDYRAAMTIMEKYGDRVTVLRSKSVDAAATFEDGTVDFVYVDGLHDFDSVMQDIRAWYPKVRSGGVIAGHDYSEEYLPEVKRAVDLSPALAEVKLFFTDETMSSWWGIKP